MWILEKNIHEVVLFWFKTVPTKSNIQVQRIIYIFFFFIDIYIHIHLEFSVVIRILMSLKLESTFFFNLFLFYNVLYINKKFFTLFFMASLNLHVTYSESLQIDIFWQINIFLTEWIPQYLYNYIPVWKFVQLYCFRFFRYQLNVTN